MRLCRCCASLRRAAERARVCCYMPVDATGVPASPCCLQLYSSPHTLALCCDTYLCLLCALCLCGLQVTRECLLLLRMFMELWLNVLQEQRLRSSFIDPAASGSSSSRQLQAQRLLASSSQEDASGAAAAATFGTDAPESADPACFTLDLHRLEGVFFMLLCSFDEAIRLEACSALGVLRTLHQQLYTMAEELGVQQRSGDALQVQPPAPQPQLASPGMAAAGAVGGSFSCVGTPTAAVAGGATDSAGAGAAAAVTPPASSIASGSGMFFRHKATASRDSAEFMQTLGTWGQHARHCCTVGHHVFVHVCCLRELRC